MKLLMCLIFLLNSVVFAAETSVMRIEDRSKIYHLALVRYLKNGDKKANPLELLKLISTDPQEQVSIKLRNSGINLTTRASRATKMAILKVVSEEYLLLKKQEVEELSASLKSSLEQNPELAQRLVAAKIARINQETKELYESTQGASVDAIGSTMSIWVVSGLITLVAYTLGPLLGPVLVPVFYLGYGINIVSGLATSIAVYKAIFPDKTTKFADHLGSQLEGLKQLYQEMLETAPTQKPSTLP